MTSSTLATRLRISVSLVTTPANRPRGSGLCRYRLRCPFRHRSAIRGEHSRCLRRAAIEASKGARLRRTRACRIAPSRVLRMNPARRAGRDRKAIDRRRPRAAPACGRSIRSKSAARRSRTWGWLCESSAASVPSGEPRAKSFSTRCRREDASTAKTRSRGSVEASGSSRRYRLRGSRRYGRPLPTRDLPWWGRSGRSCRWWSLPAA